MQRSDRLWSKQYSYAQALRYNEDRSIKEDRSNKAIIKKLNKENKEDKDLVFKSLYKLFG